MTFSLDVTSGRNSSCTISRYCPGRKPTESTPPPPKGKTNRQGSRQASTQQTNEQTNKQVVRVVWIRKCVRWLDNNNSSDRASSCSLWARWSVSPKTRQWASEEKLLALTANKHHERGGGVAWVTKKKNGKDGSVTYQFLFLYDFALPSIIPISWLSGTGYHLMTIL